jgi:hypothetical protein
MTEPTHQPAFRSAPGTIAKNPCTLDAAIVLADPSGANGDGFELQEKSEKRTKVVQLALASAGTPAGKPTQVVFPDLCDQRTFTLVHVRPGGVRSVVFEEKGRAEMVAVSPDPPVRSPYVTRRDQSPPPGPVHDPDLLPAPTKYIDRIVPEPLPRVPT